MQGRKRYIVEGTGAQDSEWKLQGLCSGVQVPNTTTAERGRRPPAKFNK